MNLKSKQPLNGFKDLFKFLLSIVGDLYLNFNTKGYFCEDDPFIWQEITFLPQQMQLLVTGNYWACPSEIVSYSCAACTALPYPILQRTYTPK